MSKASLKDDPKKASKLPNELILTPDSESRHPKAKTSKMATKHVLDLLAVYEVMWHSHGTVVVQPCHSRGM